jgi:hypothetical protein
VGIDTTVPRLVTLMRLRRRLGRPHSTLTLVHLWFMLRVL